MNERIQELRGQVKLDIDQYRESLLKLSTVMLADDGANEVLNAYLAKFAELIVRECALVAKTLPHTPERHWVTDSVTYIPVHCEQNILKHFGVEE